MNYIIETQINPYVLPGIKPGILFKSKFDILEEITLKVCNYFNTDLETIRGRNQNRTNSDCRHIAMYFLKKSSKLYLSEIGRYFNRDHSTVIHAIGVCNDLIETNKMFRNHVENIEQVLSKV